MSRNTKQLRSCFQVDSLTAPEDMSARVASRASTASRPFLRVLSNRLAHPSAKSSAMRANSTATAIDWATLERTLGARQAVTGTVLARHVLYAVATSV